jgi:hypothetical protein
MPSKKKVRKDKFGVPKRGSIQSVSDWEPIPEAEKHKVAKKWHDGVQVFNSDLDAALRAAQADKKKRFS